jgi:hypothetical protein
MRKAIDLTRTVRKTTCHGCQAYRMADGVPSCLLGCDRAAGTPCPKPGSRDELTAHLLARLVERVKVVTP